MYYLYGSPKILLESSSVSTIEQILSIKEGHHVSILYPDKLLLYYSEPTVLAASTCRSKDSIKELGCNFLHCWNNNCTVLALATRHGHIIFYNVKIFELEDDSVYNLDNSGKISNPLHDIHIQQFCVSSMGANIKSMTAMPEYLLLATDDHYIRQVQWNGIDDKSKSLCLRHVQFIHDMENHQSVILNGNFSIVDLAFMHSFSTLVFLLQDGRAGIIFPEDCKGFRPGHVKALLMPNLYNATCLTVNEKFRHLVFGNKIGQVLTYSLDSTLMFSCFLKYNTGELSNDEHSPVVNLCCSDDGYVILSLSKSGMITMHSVFGYNLWRSSLSLRVSHFVLNTFSYHLWMVIRQRDPPPQTGAGLIVQPFVKSVLVNNPVCGNDKHVVLQGASKLLVGLSNTHNMWKIVQIPPAYMASNYPLNYLAIDCEGVNIAVAGKYGFCTYSLQKRKWKLFGNEIQERQISCVGGLVWIKHLIIGSFRNHFYKQFEIRVYSKDQNLENSFCAVISTSAQIHRLNVFNSILVTFNSHCILNFYNIQVNTVAGRCCKIDEIQETPISQCIRYEDAVISLNLSGLTYETVFGNKATDVSVAQSLVMNVAGCVILFQRDTTVEEVEVPGQIPLCTPVTVASSVEMYWLSENDEDSNFAQSLILNCGIMGGLKVWLPLKKTQEFVATKNMLSFPFSIYPLGLNFTNAILHGASFEVVLLDGSQQSITYHLPQFHIDRNEEIVLHRIIIELLKRNLGQHALSLVRNYKDMSFITHAMELMLHQVLEAEATASEPVPDPFLPVVVSFLKEFPFFRRVLAYCARKTEVALWAFLFLSAGDPKVYFEECLTQNDLETAASYLIVLQNLKPLAVSKNCSIALVDCALENKKWSLSRDIIRYLKSICVDSSCEFSSRALNPPSPMYPIAGNPLLTHVPRTRQSSVSDSQLRSLPSPLANKPTKKIVKRSQTVSEDSAGDPPDIYYISSLISRHARKLLSQYEVKSLAEMSAKIEFDLHSFLAKERKRAAQVDDFVQCLESLHENFSWPYPVVAAQKKLPPKSSSTGSLSSRASSLITLQESEPLTVDIKSSFQIPDPSNIEESATLSSQENEGINYVPDADTWSVSSSDEKADRLELLVKQAFLSGSDKSNKQLKYLLKVFSVAECFEWAVLLATVLSDIREASSILNNVSLSSDAHETGHRIICGMKAIDEWSKSFNPGYQPYLLALQPYIQVLQTVLHFTAKLPSPKTVCRTSSIESNISVQSNPPLVNNVSSEEDHSGEIPEIQEERSLCSVS